MSEIRAANRSRRPANLIYGLNDSVPLTSLVPFVLQQVIMLSVDLVFPVLVVAAMGGSVEMAQTMVSMMMISMGFGTLMQAYGKKSLGSGYFCAHETGSPYFPVSVMAVQAGGIPLLCGMTVLTGFFQVLFSRVVHRLRVLFPVEITGLIVTLMAIVFITYAIPNFIGMDETGRSNPQVFLLSSLTLAIIISMHIWGNRRLREYSIIVGILFGYVCSYALGMIPAEQLEKFRNTAWIALPSLDHIGFSIEPALIAPFLIASLCSSIKTIGNLTTCQKVNDDNWKRLDIKSVGDGLLAEGLGTVGGGLLGTMAQTTSSGSVGLAVATGATSRQIGIGAGLCFILLAFLPKMAAVFAIMPQSVIGVILMVEIAFVMPTAMQICSSRMLDGRRIFVLGVSLAFGLGVVVEPGFAKAFPVWLQPLVGNALAVGTIIAISLHMLFRIGIASHQKIEIMPGQTAMEDVVLFFQRSGGSWGARPEVVAKATSALNEFLEMMLALQLNQGPILVDASFEEFNLNVDVSYQGELLEISKSRPTELELLEDDAAFIRLSGFLLTKYADQISSERKNERCHIHFNFQH